MMPKAANTVAISKEPAIKILIADDHAILRGGLRELLGRLQEGLVCGEAENAQKVLAEVQRQPWDALILDITMPGRSGIDILKDLRLLQPNLPVLILSMHSEFEYAKRVLRAGARGYLEKKSAPRELLRAVRTLLAGRRYVSPALAQQLAQDLRENVALPLHEALSAREFEILVMIGSGNTVGKIAEELHLSVTTVSTYRARILLKLSMATTADLIGYAFRNNLVD